MLSVGAWIMQDPMTVASTPRQPRSTVCRLNSSPTQIDGLSPQLLANRDRWSYTRLMSPVDRRRAASPWVHPELLQPHRHQVPGEDAAAICLRSELSTPLCLAQSAPARASPVRSPKEVCFRYRGPFQVKICDPTVAASRASSRAVFIDNRNRVIRPTNTYSQLRRQ